MSGADHEAGNWQAWAHERDGRRWLELFYDPGPVLGMAQPLQHQGAISPADAQTLVALLTGWLGDTGRAADPPTSEEDTMGSVREPVNTGAMKPGEGRGASRQLAGKVSQEEAERVLAEEAGVVTRDTSSGQRTEDRSVTDTDTAERQTEAERASARRLSERQTDPADAQGGEETGDRYDAMSTEDLRTEAGRRDITGRSNMTKAQLQRALRLDDASDSG